MTIPIRGRNENEKGPCYEQSCAQTRIRFPSVFFPSHNLCAEPEWIRESIAEKLLEKFSRSLEAQERRKKKDLLILNNHFSFSDGKITLKERSKIQKRKTPSEDIRPCDDLLAAGKGIVSTEKRVKRINRMTNGNIEIWLSCPMFEWLLRAFFFFFFLQRHDLKPTMFASFEILIFLLFLFFFFFFSVIPDEDVLSDCSEEESSKKQVRQKKDIAFSQG
ncbi:DEAD box helicase, putative [Plasmodium ovale wallikeri]|nr:DEAD box helicase, putative [Plasmodium ovale wallikeri]